MIAILAFGCGPSDPEPGARDPSDPSSPGESAPAPPTPADSGPPDPPPESDTGIGAPRPTRFDAPGPVGVIVATERWDRPAGCTLPLTTYTPELPTTDVRVVIAHGFSRSRGAVEDWGQHLASWGIPAVTVSLCHSTPFDNEPDTDAADLVALADHLGAARRLYAGHSAGGLRAVLAGVGDPAAVGVFGLDLVDAFDLALEAAPGLSAPFAGVAGERSSCNAGNNGDAVFAAAPAGAALLHVADADHCDFEWPTDVLCTAFCDAPGARPDDEIRGVIRGLATGWIAWRTGADAGGAAWWGPGEAGYDALVGSSAIRP